MKKSFSIVQILIIAFVSIMTVVACTFSKVSASAISITLPPLNARAAAPSDLSYYKVAVFNDSTYKVITDDEFTPDFDIDENDSDAQYLDKIFKSYAYVYNSLVKPAGTVTFSQLDEDKYTVFVMAYNSYDMRIAYGEANTTVTNNNESSVTVKMTVIDSQNDVSFMQE